jgi:DNA-binding MarR family transcriptional regulator
MQNLHAEIDKLRILKQEDPDINLYVLLDQTNSIVTTAVELELRHLRITRPQVRVLMQLSREDRPITIEELANWNLKRFNSVYVLIIRMEKNGLVKKIKKEGDLKTYITLTERGSICYHQKVTERSIKLIFGKLSVAEKKRLETLLKKVRDTTRDLLGLDFKPPFLP